MVKLQGTAPNQVPTNADLGSLAYADHDNVNLTAADLKLKALSKTKSLSADGSTLTAVDVFIYDTSKDSDGGAWRHRTQHTSWYNEGASNTRGSRKEFPAVAVIVAETDKITIYDGDDPSLPMWWTTRDTSTTSGFGILRQLNNYAVQAISMLNGRLVAGLDFTPAGDFQSNEGVHVLDFAADRAYKTANSVAYSGYVSPLTSYPDTDITVSTQYAGAIVNGNINDVAMTVLPDAPTDPATGLEIPTIAVATDGGVSVIKDDGTVVDIVHSDKAETRNVTFGGDDLLIYNAASFIHARPIPTADVSAGDRFVSNAADVWFAPRFKDASYTGGSFELHPSGGNTLGDMLQSGNFVAIQNSDRLNLARVEGTYAEDNALSAFVTSTYNTGWMPGDIKLAALANSATADRSVNNNPLTQNGTITAAPVATGADVVGYSNFSSSTNYLKQPYHSGILDGTGQDIFITGWVHRPASGQAVFADFGEVASGKRRLFYIVGSTDSLAANNGAAQVNPVTVPSDTWVQCGLIWYANNDLKFYINGQEVGTGTLSRTAQTQDNPLYVGGGRLGSNASTKLALIRISATAPTADQIRKIYEDEKFLFQDSAKATLTGNSDAVTALAHDPDTNLLHVGTSDGRSVFQGLRRVEEHTDTDNQSLAAISAVDGLVVEGK